MFLKNVFLIIAYLALVGSIDYPAFAQNNAIIKYQAELKGGFQAEFTLAIVGAQSLYKHLEEPDKRTNDQGWEFYQYKDHIYWYYNSATGKIIEKRMKDGYPTLIAEWTEKMEWTITDEIKTIKGYTVQKAIRRSLNLSDDHDDGDVIAWFAVDLPFSTGPERYHGLPGLILQLEFTNSRQEFMLQEITFPDDLKIKPPTGGIQVSKEQVLRPYDRIDKKWLKAERKRLDMEVN
ncbi:MAG: GLPGLI family protein [Bacteroidota bacterium]